MRYGKKSRGKRHSVIWQGVIDVTKAEVGQMLDFAMACYPNTQIKDLKKMLEVWAMVFAPIDTETAMTAMQEVCQRSKWFPSVADIMNEIGSSKGDGIPWRIAPP